jgi:iron transport multicopper oxidase
MRFLKAAALAAASLFAAAEATVILTWTLTEGNISPDGFSRKYTLINGASPGPTINLNQGDEVKIVVTNLAAENATIHFHGMCLDLNFLPPPDTNRPRSRVKPAGARS